MKHKRRLPWIMRETYVCASFEDLRSGKHLRLQADYTNHLYRYHNGIIQLLNEQGKWEDTNLVPDIGLFCVKEIL